ncbi:hypothetical protein J2T20_002933 [Paenibacillus wynnii]|nr:hypothetical protein [Paenibacillus wynnii]
MELNTDEILHIVQNYRIPQFKLKKDKYPRTGHLP